jgi:CheY-like chemotaxis protein
MPTVLIVDDSRLAREMVKKTFAALYPDWHTLTAANGEEALQVVAETPPDVAILDFNMPGMDGLTLASLLRERHPDLRIGILTANVQDAIRQRASSLDCVFIPKPATEAKIRGFVTPDPD